MATCIIALTNSLLCVSILDQIHGSPTELVNITLLLDGISLVMYYVYYYLLVITFNTRILTNKYCHTLNHNPIIPKAVALHYQWDFTG